MNFKKIIVYIKVWALIYFSYLFNRRLKFDICITTAKGYADKTLKNLIPSLVKYGIPYQNIYVFEGGYYENKQMTNVPYHHYLVNHNSFDLTCFISILELNIKKK